MSINLIENTSSDKKSEILARKISKPEEQLEELLTCQICYTIAKNIMMCPNCSKIYCETCIKKSLSIKSECPHCRKNIRDHKSMANCQRFVNEVKVIVEQVLKEKQKENFRCDQHDVPLNYYCLECQRSVCCECKMFGSHKQHNLVQIEKKYQQKYEKLRSILAQLKVAVKEKEETISKFQNLLDHTNFHYKQELHHISNIEKSCDSKYLKEIKSRKEEEQKSVQKLEGQLQKLSQMRKSLRSQFSKLKKEGKYNFCEVQKSKLQKTVEEMNSQAQSMECKLFNHRSYLSEFIPPYSYQILRIQNFSKRQSESKCIVYSDPVEIQGCEWKLKVYPNGSDSVQGKYLSVYVMMLSNRSQHNKSEQKLKGDKKNMFNLYEYSIEIESKSNKHQKQEQSSIVSRSRSNQHTKQLKREYASTFEPGESWGYIKFIQLKQLYASGYIDQADNDSLTIKYGIRRPDYYNAYKSLLDELQSVESEIQSLQYSSLPQKQQTQNYAESKQIYGISEPQQEPAHFP